jgi:hypothetical protein
MHECVLSMAKCGKHITYIDMSKYMKGYTIQTNLINYRIHL